jgi:outer membrane protein assembly factor BamB
MFMRFLFVVGVLFGLTGLLQASESLPIGWNLLGAKEDIANPKSTSSAEIVWSYDGSWTQDPDNISKGSGFWVKIAEATEPFVPTVIEKEWIATGFTTPESVIYDESNDVLYVSNINASPWSVDTNKGWISKVGTDGTIIEQKWISDLQSPKGMGIYNGKLYVADIGLLRIVDIASKTVEQSIEVSEAYLNDIAVSDDGRIFVSDVYYGQIFELQTDTLELLWSENTQSVNGLYAKDGNLIYGGSGNLYSLDLASMQATTIATGLPFDGNDGIESDGQGGYFVSNFDSKIAHVRDDGSSVLLVDMFYNAADIMYNASSNTLYIPTFSHNSVEAYHPN